MIKLIKWRVLLEDDKQPINALLHHEFYNEPEVENPGSLGAQHFEHVVDVELKICNYVVYWLVYAVFLLTNIMPVPQEYKN